MVDLFAARNIPIRTMERASGFVATRPLLVDLADGERWADCGTALGKSLGARQAEYNVLVRGDSTSATVRATVLWERPGSPAGCVTRGVWESDFEAAVKARAEAATVAR